MLSITQDLAALGLGRGKAIPRANWVDTQFVASAKLSDLQRAVAGKLLQSGEARTVSNKERLTEILHRFINHGRTFAVITKRPTINKSMSFYIKEYDQ